MQPSNVLIKAILIPIALFSISALAQTGIGSGGDVVEAYLEETRVRFVETIQKFTTLTAAEKSTICQGQGLRRELEEDCATFIATTAHQMTTIAVGPNRVPFILSTSPVAVPGPGGQPMRVAAMTPSGPQGPVTFDYELIARRTPHLMVSLLAHELGHKVEFNHGADARQYVLDDEPILGFSTGRALLDATGLALSNLAMQKGIIGAAFLIKDRFYCEVRISPIHAFYQAGDDTRDFATDEDRPYDVFRAGIGPSRGLQVGLVQRDSCLDLRLELVEGDGCRSGPSPRTRSVDLAIYRVFPPVPDQPTRSPVLLREHRIEGFNPACEDDPRARELPMAIEAGGVTFTCFYKGMSAGTHERERRDAGARLSSGCAD